MDVYHSRHAELYDLFYASKDYKAEVDFVREVFSRLGVRNDARVLDLACGTGRHAAELVANGFDVVGVDFSLPMAQIAREERDLSVVCGDMRMIPLRSRTFPSAVCLFDAIGYARTNNGIQSAIDELARILETSGVVLIEFWHAPAMLLHHDPVRVRRWNRPGGEVVRVSETTLSIPDQTASVRYSIFDLGDDGSVERWTETHVNRFFQVQEMAAFLERSGFEVESWHPGFDDGAIDDTTWHVVVAARSRSNGGD